jgi:hypothetical protein
VKTKRFSVEQIVAVLKEAELGTPAAELVRKVGISEQTFYRWKKVYGGLEPARRGGRGEREVEAPSGESVSRQDHAAGMFSKKS